MRTNPILLLCAALGGCGGGDHHATSDALEVQPDTAQSGTTTITILPGAVPLLVAFREGLDGPWQTASMINSTTYEAVVHGPYVVSEVCAGASGAGFSTIETAQVPADGTTIANDCGSPAATSFTVSGHMVQAGQVMLSEDQDSSTTPAWDFALTAGSGTYDLLGLSADHIALRHGISVTADVAVATPLDVVEEGAPLASVAFSVTNATASESLVASVAIESPAFFFARLYEGPIATATIAPDSVLVATDIQSASLQATDGGHFRALRRPIHAGGDTAYTLPAALGAGFSLSGAAFATTWDPVPAAASVELSINGIPDSGAGNSLDLWASPAFVTATGITQLTLATDMPGYLPAWNIDPTTPYDESLTSQAVVNGEVTTTSFDQQFNVSARRAPARRPRRSAP